MTPEMIFRKRGANAYLAIAGKDYGLGIDGADLAQLLLVLKRFEGDEYLTNKILHDFYIRAARDLHTNLEDDLCHRNVHGGEGVINPNKECPL